MGMSVNTNIISLNAQRNLNTSQSALSTAMQRLSSGMRVNSAKDDAAGLAIAERMGAQVRGLNVASRNANDGISLAQTAEGALGKIGDMLQRVRELAVQSANATNSTSDRDALQAEVAQLKEEIGRVATQTQFNGLNLLDGSFTAQSFQVGANQGQTIDVASIANANIASLGTWTSASTAAVAGSYTTGQASSLDFSTAGSALVGGTNVLAAVTAGDFTGAGALSFDVDGTAVTINTDHTGDLDALAADIEGQLTGYTVVNNAGEFTITNTASAAAVAITNADANAVAAGIVDGAGTAGSAAVVTSNLSFDVDGTTVTLNSDYSGNLAGMITDIQAAVGSSYVVASNGAAGFSITSATAGAATPVTVDNFTTSSITGVSGGTAVAGADAVAGTAQTGFSSLDVSTVTGANNAMLAMDAAINTVNSARGTLGAVQSRFENAISNIQTTAENLTAARARIIDADFAQETANLSRSQILQQAGTAMVAQANQLPQQVLSLLR